MRLRLARVGPRGPLGAVRLMYVPIPFKVSEKISTLAARRAREGIQRRQWSTEAVASLHPAPAEGKVGVRTSRKYLMYQERGTKPRLMTELEGKTVPIKGRFYRVRGVGLPGMGYQDRKRDPIKGPVWRDQRWRHPGIQPEGFMKNAISQAILESRPTLVADCLRVLGGERQQP